MQFPQPLAVMNQLAASLGYATMSERFIAFLCDASIEAIIVGCFLAMFYLRSSLDFDALKEAAALLIPIAYMSLSEFFFHGTIGKRLLRIELRADSLEPSYPSLFRILVRESLGKFLCGLIFGIGFLAGGVNAKKKTWADRMAKTVVVRTGTVQGPVKFALVLILIGVYAGVAVALAEIPSMYSRNLADRLFKTEGRIDDLHEQIFKTLFSIEPQSPKEYQQKLATLPSMLNEYDRLIVEEQEVVWRSQKLGRPISSYQSGPQIYKKVNRLRQEIAQLVRKHVQMVLAFDAQRQSWKDVLQDRRQMIDDVNLRNNQINKVGSFYVRRKISFAGL